MQDVVKQLDHIIARTDDARALFDLMSETLGLPVAWPLKSYPAFMSGGVSFGNVNLEILSCGPRRKVGAGEASARLCAIVFEADPLSEAEKELSARKIPHTPVVPYAQKVEGVGKVEVWANVLLGRLLGKHFWLDAAILMSRLPGAASMSNAAQESRLMKWQFDKLFSRSMVFLVEYAYRNFSKLPEGSLPHWAEFKNQDEKRAADRASLDAAGGGAIGLREVREVIAGVKDFEAARELWNRLMGKQAEVSQGFWKVSDSPAVRLVPAERDGIRSLVLTVASLEKAEAFLSEKGMLGAARDGLLTIAPEKLFGLDVRLAEETAGPSLLVR